MSGAEQSPFWARKRTALAFGALALVFVLSVGSFLSWRAQRDRPEETIAAIAAAAMKGDADRVVASIDATTIVDSAVDELFSNGEESSALLSEYLRTHPNVTEDQVKAKARAALDEEIREHVKSGTLPKRIPIGSSSLKALVAEAMARRSIRSVDVDGNIAHVVVAVRYKGKNVRVKVRMRRSGGNWKIDEIENLASVLKQTGY